MFFIPFVFLNSVHADVKLEFIDCVLRAKILNNNTNEDGIFVLEQELSKGIWRKLDSKYESKGEAVFQNQITGKFRVSFIPNKNFHKTIVAYNDIRRKVSSEPTLFISNYIVVDEVTSNCKSKVNLKIVNKSNNNIYFYPNPAKFTITFKNVLWKDMNSIDFFNIEGLKVSSIKNSNEIDISNFAPGMYFVKYNGKNTPVQKLVIVKP